MINKSIIGGSAGTDSNGNNFCTTDYSYVDFDGVYHYIIEKKTNGILINEIHTVRYNNKMISYYTYKAILRENKIDEILNG